MMSVGVQDCRLSCWKEPCHAHQVGWLAPVTQPAPQRFVRNLWPDVMAESVGVDDAAGRVVQTEDVRAINAYLDPADVEGRHIELVPSHRRGHEWLPHSARHGDVMNRWNDVGQLVASKR